MDADPAKFPTLRPWRDLNGVSTTPWVQRFEKVRKKDLENVDILFGDICFWDELVKPVGQMINRAIDAGVGTIVIGDPERPTFHEMAERAIQTHGGELLDWRISGRSKRHVASHSQRLIIPDRPNPSRARFRWDFHSSRAGR